MICIKEDEPAKIPGMTSLFVSFPFNQEIVDMLKTQDVYCYDKKSRVWELPVSSLSFLLDNLTYYDDITFDTYADNAPAVLRKPELSYRTKPFPYQMDGISYGINHDRWLLLDEPGLGKTLQALYIAEELHHRKTVDHCLIICGINTLKTNWMREIKAHSSLDGIILGQHIGKHGAVSYASVKDRATQLRNPISEFFVITNIESFRDDEMVKAFQKSSNSFGMIVLDEAHCCKSPTSKQGHNLLQLDSPVKIAMTGTLLLNSPLDAYVPLKWIGAEKSTYTNFKEYYCLFDDKYRGRIMGYRNLPVLKDSLMHSSLRRTKELLDLPPKTVIYESVDMGDEQRKFYDGVRSGVHDEADKVDIDTASVLALTTRLRQATACPSVLSTTPPDSAKIDRAVDLAKQITDNGDKVVIFCTFKESARNLSSLLSDESPLVATGDQSQKDIDDSIVSFQKDQNRRILIATWQKMGTGITLTAANYAIFIDTPWTYGAFSQTCDRIYRIGTGKHVFIYVLYCTGTVDEEVNVLVGDKQAMGDYIIDDHTTPREMNALKKYIQGL